MATLQTSIKSFLLHCQFERNLSHKTISAYNTDLLQLNTFLESKGCDIDVSTITKHELREFLANISSLKPKTITRKIASIKALFNHLEFEDIIVVNPLRKMRIKIKEAKTLPTVLDLKEITKIYKVAHKRKDEATSDSYSYTEAVRNIVVIELLFTTGARVSEIANLRVHDINLDSGIVLIKGKGNKERIIQITNRETIDMLKAYNKLNKVSRGNFLTNRLGNKLSDQSIRQIVKNFSKKAGLNKHITPHVFRHSFATLLLEKDVDIKYIQSLLGHSSINTTQIYTHVNRKKQREILRAKHPRKDFSMESFPPTMDNS